MKKKKWIRRFWSFGDTFLKAVAFFIICYYWVFQVSVVQGNSMYPLFSTGDILIVDKLSLWFQPIQQGELVVFLYPRDLSKEYLKRVIGCPLDTVKIEDGQVWVNGKELSFPGEIEHQSSTKDGIRTLLTAEFFVMGDNRPVSQDSRDFGPVPQGYIKGRVFLRFWPLKQWTFF
jgi:signal peptidase I